MSLERQTKFFEPLMERQSEGTSFVDVTIGITGVTGLIVGVVRSLPGFIVSTVELVFGVVVHSVPDFGVVRSVMQV